MLPHTAAPWFAAGRASGIDVTAITMGLSILDAIEILFIVQCKDYGPVSVVNEFTVLVKRVGPRVFPDMGMMGHQMALVPVVQMVARRLKIEG